jgi:hypothetical protein
MKGHMYNGERKNREKMDYNMSIPNKIINVEARPREDR